MSLSLGWPLALVGLALCPLLVALALRSRAPVGLRRRRAVVLTRTLALALLVLAVADLRLGLPTDELAVAVVSDTSASVSEAERRRIAERAASLAAEHPTVAFVDLGHGAGLAPSTPADVVAASAALPRDHVRRIALATDGRDADGRLAAAVLAARSAGVHVHLLAAGDVVAPDHVAVAELSVPRLVRAEETVTVGVRLHADAAREVTLVARVGEDEVARETARVSAGDSEVPLEVRFPDVEGVHRLSVDVLSPGDPREETDRFTALVRVADKPRVLLGHDREEGEPSLARVLRDAGMRVDALRTTGLPSDAEGYEPYLLAILDEADPGELSEDQQEAARVFVEEQGGGLVTITGDHAVRRSPTILRALEPVMPPPAIPEPRPLELLLVIDRSGSMSGYKLAQARAASAAAIAALREDARVGVVAFSDGADRVMAPVGMDQREQAVAFVQSIQAGGGTNIAAALRSANGMISADPRYIHHVILLSDGESDAGPALEAARAVAGRGASISAITLGPRSALMAEIARIGRGRYHVTNSAGSLPSLFVREAMFRQPPAHRRVTFVPGVVTRLAMLDGVDVESAPPLTGHALAATRDEAVTVLRTADASPLLAHWNRGLGQVATWTSATDGAWADGFREWEGYRGLWAALAEGMSRKRTPSPPELRLAADPMDPEMVRLTVIAPTTQTSPAPVVRLLREPTVDGADEHAETLRLAVAGPGVFTARIAAGDGFLVDARMPEDPEPAAAVAHDRPFDPELARFGVDAAGLERLARLGGGAVMAELDEVLGPADDEVVPRSLRTVLLALALFLYLLGVLLLRLPDESVAAVVAPARLGGRSRRRPSHAPPPPVDLEEAA